MKWLRRCVFVLIVLGFGAILLGLAAFLLLRGTPDYYDGHTLSPEEQAAAAGSAENKFREILNSADLARRDSALARQAEAAGTTRPATAPVPIVVTFTDDELNSVFQKWSELNNWKSAYEQYITDPVVVFQPGRIILAGRVSNNDLHTVVSVQFEPMIRPDGLVELKLVRALAGRLPLPQAMFQKYLDKAVSALEQHLPRWQAQAKISATGDANNDAIAAQLSKLAIAALHQQPADGVIFLPTAGRANVPVKVVDANIGNGSIQFSLQPLTPEQRAALLQRIKSPIRTQTASSD